MRALGFVVILSAAFLLPCLEAAAAPVDASTLTGKVMCGYQGWFGVAGDRGPEEHRWQHWTYASAPPKDGAVTVDLWPDVSELADDERFDTDLHLTNGRPAQVFTSYKRPTVLRHFKWMQDYGIDGVFVQRFIGSVRRPSGLERCNTVLNNCREGAKEYGRVFAVMYDLSGLGFGRMGEVTNDWLRLVRDLKVTQDPAYLHHHGKPVVAVWGIGFNDGRAYTSAECREMVDFFKNNPAAGGCTLMLGVPAYWRSLARDTLADPLLLDVIGRADIVSPWTVGRYTDDPGAQKYAQNTLKGDLEWCRQRKLDLLPVIFPGFSWHNLKGGQLNQIPRRHGNFMWSQFCQDKEIGATMLYVAMFDEVDEGTAIFKCSNDVPVGQESQFVTFEGLPSDYYLRLVGAGTKLLRGEIPITGHPPFSQ